MQLSCILCKLYGTVLPYLPDPGTHVDFKCNLHHTANDAAIRHEMMAGRTN